ncbi:MAG: 4-hydroxythreonine-4-phosphate dehydrogenase, partial [Sulfurovum sp. 17-42-90]
MKKKVAISVGDLNGIGIQLALENHHTIAKVVEPLYCIDRAMLEQAAQKLSLPIPADFQTLENIAPYFEIKAGTVSASSGAYAYASFAKAVELARQNKVAAISTLPIHKKAWELAGVTYKGHTDAL